MSTEPPGHVLITGGTKGIGLAIARAFLDNGDRVTLLYGHDRGAAERALASLAADGRVTVVQCDVSDAARLQAVIEQAWQREPLRALINNAAVMNRGSLLDASLQEWQRLMDTNLRAYFVGTQAFARLAIRDSRGGVIVNVSSAGQIHAARNQGVYLVAKGGVAMLTRTFALELGPHHINVNGVAPGTTRTEMNREELKDREFLAENERKIPLGRLGEPSEVAPAVVFLASPAASYINGATLFVDGGSTIW